MGRILIVVLALPLFFHICFANGRSMNEQELREFLKNFYSHYTPSYNRESRDLSVIPPGASVYQEPSFRDLDVGIGIGVKEDDSDLKYSSPSQYPLERGYISPDQSKEITFGVYVDPRNGVSYYLPQALQPQQLYSGIPQQSAIFNPQMNFNPAYISNPQPTNFVVPNYGMRTPNLVANAPLSPYNIQPTFGYGTAIPSTTLQYPLAYNTPRTPSALPYFIPAEQSNRYGMPTPLPYFTQPKTADYGSPMYQFQPMDNGDRYGYPGYTAGGNTFRKFLEVEENRPYYRRDLLGEIPRDNVALMPRREPSQVILDPQQGVPVMIAEPYGERQVGAFRLRNDHGYQVMMNVPRITENGPSEGVLVMEMKATLFRPIQ